MRPLAERFQWFRGLLYAHMGDGDLRIFPGPARRAAIVDEFHRRYLHLGVHRLSAILGATFYWPGLRQ